MSERAILETPSSPKRETTNNIQKKFYCTPYIWQLQKAYINFSISRKMDMPFRMPGTEKNLPECKIKETGHS